jgi:peptidoglycan/xylan/chitin deacetylase (PgdA/CDA1 family)
VSLLESSSAGSGAGPHRDFVGYGEAPPSVQWPGGARVAISLVVNYEEGSEYSLLDGDARNELLGERPHQFPDHLRDLRVESVHEYGSRAGIWRLLRTFSEYDLRTTFFATAVALERNPHVATAATAGRHEICGHGYRWTENWNFTREEERRSIRDAVESIAHTCGQRPRGWCCRNSSTISTRELLVEEGGFLYDSDAYNDDLPYFVEVLGKTHLVIPYDLVHNDIRYVTPPGFASPEDFLRSATASLDCLWREGETTPKMMSVGLHPRWSGQPARTDALRRFIEYALELGDVWFARRVDIAAHWWNNYGGGCPPFSAQVP